MPSLIASMLSPRQQCDALAVRYARISIALVCLLGLGSGCAHVGSISPLAPFERSVLFQPTPYPDGNWNPVGLNQEDAWFESVDGARLHGWFVAPARPRAVALFLHGNAGNITGRESVLRVLRDRHNLAVMTFDNRGYGRSSGEPNESGILKDARAARAWLAKRTGVHERNIIVFGRSLVGGGHNDVWNDEFHVALEQLLEPFDRPTPRSEAYSRNHAATDLVPDRMTN
jgi:hypothetical protein